MTAATDIPADARWADSIATAQPGEFFIATRRRGGDTVAKVAKRGRKYLTVMIDGDAYQFPIDSLDGRDTTGYRTIFTKAHVDRRTAVAAARRTLDDLGLRAGTPMDRVRVSDDDLIFYADTLTAAVAARNAASTVPVPMAPQPADSYVWCDMHDTFHPKTDDPYDMGAPECGRGLWRTVYVDGAPGETF